MHVCVVPCAFTHEAALVVGNRIQAFTEVACHGSRVNMHVCVVPCASTHEAALVVGSGLLKHSPRFRATGHE